MHTIKIVADDYWFLSFTTKCNVKYRYANLKRVQTRYFTMLSRLYEFNKNRERLEAPRAIDLLAMS